MHSSPVLKHVGALGIDFVSVTEAVDTSLPAGEPVFQMIGTEGRELRRLRIQQPVPFRELAERFGVSVWTAHTLCARRG